jgi:uncharacterized membrane protein
MDSAMDTATDTATGTATDALGERGAGRADGGARAAATSPARRAGNGRQRRDDRLADALGWFSVGLGLAQLVAPDRMTRLVGAHDGPRSRTLMRTLGMRELASGVGILSSSSPGPWLWARVAGDMMDLAILGNVAASDDARSTRALAATAAVLGVTALDAFAGQRLTGDQAATEPARRGIHVTRSITVNRPVGEVYAFWRDFAQLPRFMRHLESVQVTGERRSHWKAKAPAGMSGEWDAELVEDRPDELIAWRSLEGADVDNAGTVRFRPAPGDRGTEVTVELRYDPPGCVVSEKLAKLFREEPEQQVRDDLAAFKQVMETGEVLLSDATAQHGAHAAHPVAHPVAQQAQG